MHVYVCLCVFVHSFHSLVLWQVYNLFQSESSELYDLVLLFTVFKNLSFS